MKKIIYVSVTLLFALGCDMVKNDKGVQPTRIMNINLFAAQNKSTVIDLKQIFPTLTSAQVTNGDGINYFDERYVSYKATSTAQDFSFVVNQPNNVVIQANVKTQGFSSSDCQGRQAFNYAKITNKESLVVNLFNNPEFCAYDPTQKVSGTIGIANSRPGIDVDQNSDGVNIAICACSGDNTAILTYKPPSSFVGQVKFTYYLFVDGDTTVGNAVYYDPRYSKYFSKHSVTIDVTK